jgi:hypothetical protein
VAFLTTEVIDRQSRGKKRKQTEESDDEAPASKTISKSLVMSYVTALTALWSTQASHGVNHHPNPRADPAVKALVQSARTENERQHANSPESTPEQQLAAAIPTVAAQLQALRREHSYQLVSLQRSIDKIQEQSQLILSNQRRFIQLLDRGSEGGSRAELADDGNGMGTQIAIAQTNSNPTMAGDRQALHLASSGETDPPLDPSHRMSRQTTTVAQLYTEWFTGLGDKPSVVQMDHQFGTKWRSQNKDKVFYSVRKTIIDHVEDRRRGGESLDAVLKHLQGTMLARSKGLQALSIAIRNWQHPGARKKRNEDWYEGPGTASAVD